MASLSELLISVPQHCQKGLFFLSRPNRDNSKILSSCLFCLKENLHLSIKMPASSQKRDPRQGCIQENRNSLEFYFLHCLLFTKLNIRQFSEDLPCYSYHFADNW